MEVIYAEYKHLDFSKEDELFFKLNVYAMIF